MLTTSGWLAFVEHMEAAKADIGRSLQNLDDANEIFRAQGKVQILQTLMTWPENFCRSIREWRKEAVGESIDAMLE